MMLIRGFRAASLFVNTRASSPMTSDTFMISLALRPDGARCYRSGPGSSRFVRMVANPPRPARSRLAGQGASPAIATTRLRRRCKTAIDPCLAAPAEPDRIGCQLGANVVSDARPIGHTARRPTLRTIKGARRGFGRWRGD